MQSERHPEADDGRYRRELQRLAEELHGRHPDVALADVSELVARADDALAGSRVQSFKLIFVERAVARQLAAVRCAASPVDPAAPGTGHRADGRLLARA